MTPNFVLVAHVLCAEQASKGNGLYSLKGIRHPRELLSSTLGNMASIPLRLQAKRHPGAEFSSDHGKSE